MTLYTTIIRAINPKTGQLCTWQGPNIDAISPKLADEYCQQNGLGYCEVDGKLTMEIPCKPGTDEPDMDNATDYYTLECN